MSTLEERLDRKEVIILDAAMGTDLQKRGVPMDHAAWSATAVLTHPDTVREVHEDNLRAGADIIITNTFAAARHVLKGAGLGDKVRELNLKAVALAKEARDRAAPARSVWIAGSISPMNTGGKVVDIDPPDVLRTSFQELAELFAEAGVDLIMLEWMWDIERTTYAVEAAQATGLPTWVGFAARMAEDGSTVVSRRRDVDTPLAEIVGPVMAVGGSMAAVMHTEVEATGAALEVVRDRWSGPLAAYAESGHFVMPNWQFEDISPEDYLAAAERWVGMGVQVVGGCCGIGPDHIRLLKDRLPSRLVSADTV